MMNYIFSVILLISIVYGIITGSSQEITNAFLSQSVEAINLFLVLLGSMALWGGVMNVAKISKLTDKISRFFSPLINKIFVDIKHNKKAQDAISMNISANLLGLGNAAIPLGIAAMEELKKNSLEKTTASTDMIMMIILNCVSMQLIPSNVAMLRLNSGSKDPFDIIIAVWIVSIITLVSGIVLVKIFDYYKNINL